MSAQFTANERDLIRTKFMVRWSQIPSLSAGIVLHRWVTGPHQGQPKLNAPVRSMLARGLVEIIEPDGRWPVAHFTAAGLDALRAMARDHRLLPPDTYGHLLEELEDLSGGGGGAV